MTQTAQSSDLRVRLLWQRAERGDESAIEELQRLGLMEPEQPWAIRPEDMAATAAPDATRTTPPEMAVEQGVMEERRKRGFKDLRVGGENGLQPVRALEAPVRYAAGTAQALNAVAGMGMTAAAGAAQWARLDPEEKLALASGLVRKVAQSAPEMAREMWAAAQDDPGGFLSRNWPDILDTATDVLSLGGLGWLPDKKWLSAAKKAGLMPAEVPGEVANTTFRTIKDVDLDQKADDLIGRMRRGEDLQKPPAGPTMQATEWPKVDEEGGFLPGGGNETFDITSDDSWLPAWRKEQYDAAQKEIDDFLRRRGTMGLSRDEEEKYLAQLRQFQKDVVEGKADPGIDYGRTPPTAEEEAAGENVVKGLLPDGTEPPQGAAPKQPWQDELKGAQKGMEDLYRDAKIAQESWKNGDPDWQANLERYVDMSLPDGTPEQKAAHAKGLLTDWKTHVLYQDDAIFNAWSDYLEAQGVPPGEVATRLVEELRRLASGPETSVDELRGMMPPGMEAKPPKQPWEPGGETPEASLGRTRELKDEFDRLKGMNPHLSDDDLWRVAREQLGMELPEERQILGHGREAAIRDFRKLKAENPNMSDEEAWYWVKRHFTGDLGDIPSNE